MMADCGIGFPKLCKSRARRMVLVMGFMVFNVLGFHFFRFLYDLEKISSLYGGSTSSTSVSVGKFSLLNGLRNSGNSSVVLRGPKKVEVLNMGNKFDNNDNKERSEKLEGDDSSGDGIDRDNGLRKRASVEKIVEFGNGAFDDLGKLNLPLLLEQIKKPDEDEESPGSSLSGEIQAFQKSPVLSGATSCENCTGFGIPSIKRKKNMGFPVGYPMGLPPVYISEMNHLLVRNRNAYHSMRPRWPSSHDQQLLAIRAQIETTPPCIKNIRELYAPAFRNISVFKRSYELMVQTLKVYAYKEGQKPIFHQPLLNGIYSSEGWFMKLMEGNRHFIVKDPRKAHLFYLPFSSRLLQSTLYVPNSHNRTLMELCLKDYLDTIATKYPFWNRTGGADHFLVACHDWAPYETATSMVLAIRALCTADVHSGFVLGKDVSLPQTYIWSAGHYLRDIGGRPANKRHILAFFAGKLHGMLRPILLQHWENKDPDMKIFGPMSSVNMSKMDYIQHMKTSKYCICPRGHEGNSPRIVESILYECVPVLISDNYVPPFFEFLNWDAFSLILPEKDVPQLKSILVSIHEKKYLKLQLGVRKVQKHFLWHTKPVKYDLFHMTLHSIWYNRLYQIRS